PDDTVVVTFDDGYRDNYTNAFPILKALGIPATIFLATDAIGTGKVLWHDRVFDAFRQTSRAVLDDYGDGATRYSLRSPAEKLEVQGRIRDWLRAHEGPRRLELVDRLVARLEVPDRRQAPGLMLDWDDVKRMHAGGVSFGSHTVTHPILTRIRPEQAREEITASKQRIQKHLGVPGEAFA